MPILEDIADMGPDAMETFTPVGMGGDIDLAEAKRRIGNRVCMIGGFDQGLFFERSTPEETRRAVRTCFEEAIWLFRDVFFREGKDIARRAVQDEVAEKLQLPLQQINKLIDSGKAHAALFQDDVAKNNYKVPGSPTLVLNEGRQLLYGNVGYRIIDANVRELLHNPEHGEASWC